MFRGKINLGGVVNVISKCVSPHKNSKSSLWRCVTDNTCFRDVEKVNLVWHFCHHTCIEQIGQWILLIGDSILIFIIWSVVTTLICPMNQKRYMRFLWGSRMRIRSCKCRWAIIQWRRFFAPFTYSVQFIDIRMLIGIFPHVKKQYFLMLCDGFWTKDARP